jgi:transglutaminase-like putative cysteine protease
MPKIALPKIVMPKIVLPPRLSRLISRSRDLARQNEESLVFRLLVQAMVIVGIIATDVAAGSLMSLWAIPLSLVGAAWSWSHRKSANLAVKFLLAMGMLLVLFTFLGRLLANLNDSRLVLAELLVQLQVLHSFDLPRRKDLGYSMAIGLILLGVAGTLSQTLAFAPWLILFLAIALPALVLDYRSRLGLERIDERLYLPWRPGRSRARSSVTQTRLQDTPLSGQKLAQVFGIVLGIGLLIFAVMPRFPGYQLQSFPVSGPVDASQQQFTEKNRDILNSGYVKLGDPSKSGGGTGNSPIRGSGDIDRTQYNGFNQVMNQNLRGVMEPQVVLRVRSQAPGFWRVLSFNRYTGQGWEISPQKPLKKINRSDWSYQFYLPTLVRRLTTQSVIQTYTVVKALPNVVPALADPRQLFFPTPEIGLDAQGSLRSPIGLQEGMTYTVVSEVPLRDRTLLRTASSQYRPKIQETYLQIPKAILSPVRQKTEELLAKSPNPLNSAYEKALYLAQTLKQTYQINPDLPFLAENEDLVLAFLLRYNGGYPDHFATALTVMLRSIGIPARLTVGFGTGQFNPLTGFYVVRNTDAHALTEVYFPKFGWFSFDPIPGHEVIPPSLEDDQTFSVLKQFWNWVASWLPSPLVSGLSILFNGLLSLFSQALTELWRFIAGSLLGLLTGSLLAVGLVFLGWMARLQWLRWRYRRQLAKLAPMARLYQQMLDRLENKGFPKHSAQTPREYLQFIYDQYPREQVTILEEITQAYVCWRYGQQPQNLTYLQGQLNLLVRSWRKTRSPLISK